MNCLDYCPRYVLWFLASLTLVLLVACGGGGGGGGGDSGGTGTLGVSLTDDAACGFNQVNITVAKVRVHQSATASENDAGWTDITLSPPRKIDLLSLTNGVLTSLGEATLTAGHYTQLRLVLDPNTGPGTANSVVLTGTSIETALSTPSAVQSGIKLTNEFDVAAGQRVDLALDFDACQSVVAGGRGYVLRPVVTVVPFVLNGIDGFVPTLLTASNVNVSAQQAGTVVASTTPNAQTGEFLIARLAPGNYDVVLTADGHATAVISAVPVPTTTSTTVVSTSAAPINLPASATHNVSGRASLNPPSSTATAYVAARQTLPAGPVVTVKSRGADLLFGNYLLTLPLAAPMLGAYSTTLPITFAAQTLSAGQYGIEATATGYKTQSVNVDISAADAAQDFTLTP